MIRTGVLVFRWRPHPHFEGTHGGNRKCSSERLGLSHQIAACQFNEMGDEWVCRCDGAKLAVLDEHDGGVVHAVDELDRRCGHPAKGGRPIVAGGDEVRTQCQPKAALAGVSPLRSVSETGAPPERPDFGST
jgi:hypothetical protein